METEAPAARRLLAGMLLVLAALKARTNLVADDSGVDGALYTDFAQHVRVGAGLVTDASLYHAGFPTFPHPSPIYPLWPWLLGQVARWVPMSVAAVWLPTLLYFGSLLLIYRWARSALPGSLLGELAPSVNAGHLAVALLGFNGLYFEHTSKPYTEGLAFFVLAAALPRFHVYFQRPGSLRGIECGAWLGVLLLVRAQMIVSAAGWFAAAAWMALAATPRRPRALGLASGALGFAAVVGPYLLHVRGYLPGAGLNDLLRFERFRATPGLSHLELLVQTDGLWAWIVDRAGGFVVAFDEASRHSYWKAFGSVYWSVPLAAVLIGADLTAAARRGERPWRRLTEPGAQPALFATVFAVGWFLSLHVLHKATFAAWNFPMRHALPCLFLFGLTNALLLRRGGVSRLVGLFLLSVTLHRGVSQIVDAPNDVRLSKDDRRSREGIVALLEGALRAKPGLIVASPRAQRLAAWTSGVGIHGVYEQTTLAELLHMVDVLGVTLVAIPDDGEQPAFLDDDGFAAHMVPVLTPPAGWRLFVPSAYRPPHDPERSPTAGIPAP